MPDISIPSWAIPLLQLVFAPLLGAAAGLWAKSRGDRDRVKAHVEWVAEIGNDGHPYSQATIWIQNLSLRKVYVVEISSRCRLFYLHGDKSTVLQWENYDDVQFPYAIDAGEVRSLWLDSNEIARVANASGFLSKLRAVVFGRSRIKLKVRTLAGGVTSTDGEPAIRPRDRCLWLSDPWWRRAFRFISNMKRWGKPKAVEADWLSL